MFAYAWRSAFRPFGSYAVILLSSDEKSLKRDFIRLVVDL